MCLATVTDNFKLVGENSSHLSDLRHLHVSRYRDSQLQVSGWKFLIVGFETFANIYVLKHIYFPITVIWSTSKMN